MNVPMCIGREAELAELDAHLGKAMGGEGLALFISGEPGIGKTVLADTFMAGAHTKDLRILNGAATAESARPFMIFTEALGDVLRGPIFEEQESKGFTKLFAVNTAGLLVAESSAVEGEMDADIFAGMLSAVQDFVRDSFDSTGEKKAGLGRLEYGNLKILVEHGAEIFLTGVFSGEEHPDMKSRMKRTLSVIEEDYGHVLQSWSGTVSEIAPVQEEIDKLAEMRFLVRRNLEGVNLRAERLRIADEILGALKGLADEKPLLMFLEDLQWADESSQFVVNYLARNIRSCPIYLLGTLRPRESEALDSLLEAMRSEGILVELALQHLGAENTSAIIDRMFPNNDFPPSLAEKLQAQSKGNPLFVTEMLKGMTDDGSIACRDGRFSLVSDTYRIPSTVEEVVNRRLETLDPNAMALVEYASCIGQSFGRDIVASNRMIREPESSLEGLVETGILRRNNGAVEFSHALFQSVIYDSIGERWKTGHHKALGEYYESAYAGNPDEVVFELARHFSKTRECAKTVDYCRRAGEKAEGSYAMELALGFYESALGALPGLGTTALPKQIDLLERTGDVRNVMGLYDDAIENFMRARDLAEDDETKARMLRKSANLLTNKGDFEDALKLTAEAVEILGDGDPLELGKIALEDGTTLFRKGDFDKAMSTFKGALETFTTDPGASDMDITNVLNGIGNVHYHRGEMKDALDYYGRSLGMAEKTGDPRIIALLLGNMGSVSLGLGNLDESLDYFHKSLEIRERIGDILGMAQTENNLGVIFQDMGELDKALVHFTKGLEMSEKLGSKVGISIILYNIGNLYHSKGELDTALDIYNRCLDIRGEIGDKQGLAYALYIIGRIFKSKGDDVKAEENFDQSLAICTEIGDKQMSIHPLCSLTEMMLERGEVAAALEQAGKALALSVDAGVRGEEGLCHRVLAMVHRHSDELDKALEELERSESIQEEVGHREELARVHKEYAYYHKARGNSAKARESMARALEMFEEMGMVLWANECREALEGL